MANVRLQHAGGFRICDGGPDFWLFKRKEILPYRKAVKAILEAAKRNDPRIQKMIEDAATEWSTYACPDFQAWPSLSPLLKQQALFSWILRQRTRKLRKQRTAEEVLIAGVAGLLHWQLNVQPRHDAYSRAVSCGRSVWFLLRREYRDYEHDDGHGTITVNKVCLNKRVRMRSRYACQRIETAIMKQAGWFMEEYGSRLVEEVLGRSSEPLKARGLELWAAI